MFIALQSTSFNTVLDQFGLYNPNYSRDFLVYIIRTSSECDGDLVSKVGWFNTCLNAVFDWLARFDHES